MNNLSSLRLKYYCPHFVEDFGPDEDEWLVCCNSDQVNDIKANFDLPIELLGRCPACLYNFRKNFCDLTCRADHSLFINVSHTVETNQKKSEEYKLG